MPIYNHNEIVVHLQAYLNTGNIPPVFYKLIDGIPTVVGT